MANFGKIDLHMHSTVSDGSDTPSELLQHVREAGLCLFALTDHDAVKGVLEMRGLLVSTDPHFIDGIEFSCRDDLGRYHILGYHYNPCAEPIRSLVDRTHRMRMEKATVRLDFLRQKFGFSFSDGEIRKLLNLDNPGKPHIANLMVKHGYAKNRQQAIREYIDSLRFKTEYIPPEEAIQSILAAGGIPVLAHPCFGDGYQLVVGNDMENRLKRLMDFGLMGVEAFYSGFSPEMRDEMLALAERFSLYVTAGSDYHGTNKLVKLGETGLNSKLPLPSGMKRFLECVEA